jgi:lysophospholipase L1-like esterase
MKARTGFLLFALMLTTPFISHAADAPDPAPGRFSKAVEIYKQKDKEETPPEHPILFYGSSSIRMWKLDEAFPDLPVLNRGFGGSHISDCIHYFDELVKPYDPMAVVFYAGDNDVAGKKTEDQVFEDFTEFRALLKKHFPDCPLLYIPIKPSLARWDMWPAMKAINARIAELAEEETDLTYVDTATPMIRENGKPGEDLFIRDGLHMNDAGYDIWNAILRPYLEGLDHPAAE